MLPGYGLGLGAADGAFSIGASAFVDDGDGVDDAVEGGAFHG